MPKVKIKKITEEQASQYFSQQEDLLNSPIRFYTKTEDEDGGPGARQGAKSD